MFIDFSKNIVKLMIAAVVVFGMAACSKTAVPEEIMSVEEIAIDGYDPVAYFTASKAYKADATFSYSYKGLTWYFESNENFEAFKTNPEAYIPVYGGFCAYEVAEGDIEESDPRYWHIHNKQLYLFNDEDAKEEWFRDIDAMLTESNSNWALMTTPEAEAE